MEFLSVEIVEPQLRLYAPLSTGYRRPEAYRPAAGLHEAADVAMLLGVPLLLTGEPGSGKTSAAGWLAHILKAGMPLRFDIKSSTTGRDLLYSFDEVARFRDANRKDAPKPLVSYLTFNALGEAILRASGSGTILCGLDGEKLEGAALEARREQLEEAFGKPALANGKLTLDQLFLNGRDYTPQGQHRVVLIDELDKAPRDTPNDLLAEVEDMSFAIPELGIRVMGSALVRPIVVITSNSEKGLPEPFLRRCVYFNIPEPGDDDLTEIIGSALSGVEETILTRSAINFYREIRKDTRIQKKPGTAELIAWLDIVRRQTGVLASDRVHNLFVRWKSLQPAGLPTMPSWPLLGALMKSEDDVKHAMQILLKAQND